MWRMILRGGLTFAILMAGCKAACTTKHLDVTTTFDGRAFRDADLTAARIAGWDCALRDSQTAGGVVFAYYTCSRCD